MIDFYSIINIMYRFNYLVSRAQKICLKISRCRCVDSRLSKQHQTDFVKVFTKTLLQGLSQNGCTNRHPLRQNKM